MSSAQSIKSLKEKMPTRIVKIYCMLAEIKRILTKKGEPMVFLKLQDRSDEIEGIAFPRTLELYGHLLAPDRYMLIEGQMNNRNGVPSIICNKIEELII